MLFKLSAAQWLTRKAWCTQRQDFIAQRKKPKVTVEHTLSKKMFPNLQRDVSGHRNLQSNKAARIEPITQVVRIKIKGSKQNKNKKI